MNNSEEVYVLKQLLEYKDKEIEALKKIICKPKKNETGRKSYTDINGISLIMALRSRGNGYLKISKVLNDLRMFTNNNKPWSPSSIKFIIDKVEKENYLGGNDNEQNYFDR